MPLTQSGVNLIVKGLSTFISGMDRGTRAYQKQQQAVDRLSQRVSALGSSYLATIRNITSAYGAVQKSSILMERAIRAADALGKEFDELGDAWDEMSKAEQDVWLERIQQSIENVTLRTVDYENALDKLTNTQRKHEDVSDEEASTLEELLAQTGLLESGAIELGTALEILGGATFASGQKLLQYGKAAGTVVMSLAAVHPALAAVGLAVAGVAIQFYAYYKAMAYVVNFIKGELIKAFNLLKSVLNGVMTVAKGIVNVFANITAPIRRSLQRVFDIFTGITLYDVIRRLMSAFKGLVSEVMVAVSAFQTLKIRFAAIAARDYAQTMGVNMAEAFRMTANSAKGLLEWVKRLAVTTPYSVLDISRVMALSNAMGLNVKVSKELTKATMNFAASMGLEDEVMWRIIYNFGQMIQRGRLTGEEFRDLSRNFVPIDAMLIKMAEKAGMAKEEFRQLAFEGGVPVMDFINDFITMSKEDFPGAMEAMARTWQGVTNNVKDFIQAYVGLDLIGPTWDKITAMAAETLDTLLKSKRFLIDIKYLGQALSKAFDIIKPAVDGVTKAVGEFIRAIGFFSNVAKEGGATSRVLAEELETSVGPMTDVGQVAFSLGKSIMTMAKLAEAGMKWLSDKIRESAKNSRNTLQSLLDRAYEFGKKFIDFFAGGIMRGMLVLTSVINFIAKLLADWFGPGSPPKIASDINLWGKYMIEEWIKGFKLADFSIFEDLSGVIESYLRSMAIEEDVSLLENILGSRQMVAQVIKDVRTGLMSVGEAANRVGVLAGQASAPLQKYVSLLFQLEEASLRVKEAEAEAARITKYYDGLLKNMSSRIKVVQRDMDEVDRYYDDMLKGITARIKEEQDEVKRLSTYYDDLLDSLRAQLTEVTDFYDETVRLRKIGEAVATGLLTAEEKERLEMEKRAIMIKRQIRDVEGQRDLEVDTAQARVEALQLEQDLIEEKARLAKEEAQARIDALQLEKDLLQEQAEIAKEAADVRLEQLRGEEDLLQAQVKAMEDYFSVMTRTNELIKNLNAAIEESTDALAGLGEKNPLEPFTDYLFDFEDELAAAGLAMEDALKKAAELWAEFNSLEMKSAFEGLKKSFDTLITQIGNLDKSPTGSITDKLDRLDKLIFGGDGRVGLLKNIENLADDMDTLGKAFVAWWLITHPVYLFGLMLYEMFHNLKEIVKGLMDLSWNKLTDAIIGLADKLSYLFSLVLPPWLTNIWDFLSQYILPSLLGTGIGFEQGGKISAGQPAIVGEKRPELFIPSVSGTILPNIPPFLERMMNFPQLAQQQMAMSPVYNSSNIDNSIHINMNPNYANYQSEASVYYDVVAALASTRI